MQNKSGGKTRSTALLACRVALNVFGLFAAAASVKATHDTTAKGLYSVRATPRHQLE